MSTFWIVVSVIAAVVVVSIIALGIFVVLMLNRRDM